MRLACSSFVLIQLFLPRTTGLDTFFSTVSALSAFETLVGRNASHVFDTRGRNGRLHFISRLLITEYCYVIKVQNLISVRLAKIDEGCFDSMDKMNKTLGSC